MDGAKAAAVEKAVPEEAVPQGGGPAAGPAPAPKEALLARIAGKTAVVGVVGLGYVGLPFAVEKAKVGFPVIGIEENPAR